MEATGSVDTALAMDAAGPVVWAAWAVTVAGRITLYPPVKLESPEAACDWLGRAGADGRLIGFYCRRGRARLLVESGNCYLMGRLLAEAVARSAAWRRWRPTFGWIEVADAAKVGVDERSDGCYVISRRELVSRMADEMRRGGTVRAPNDLISGRWTREHASTIFAEPREGQPEPGVRLACELAVWSAYRHTACRERQRVAVEAERRG